MFTIMDTPVARVIADVLLELSRAEKLHPNYPHDQVRRAAITAEEAGEAIRAALDLTRINALDRVETLKTSLYTECKQTAAMAIRHMIALNGGEQ